MSRHSVTALVIALGMLMSTAGASAQEIDDRVRPGMTVWVYDDRGDRHRGRVEWVSPDAIRLFRLGDVEEIAADRIVRIYKPGEFRQRGAVIGTIGGMTVGVVAGVLAEGNPLTRTLAASSLGWIFSIVGGGIGLAIDSIIHRPRTLYERPPIVKVGVAPIVSSRSTGALVSVVW